MIDEVIQYLNDRTGKNFNPKAKQSIKFIEARIDEGATLEKFKKVIDNKVSDLLGTDQEKYLRPETLFGNKFDGYLNQKAKFQRVEAQMNGRQFIAQVGRDRKFVDVDKQCMACYQDKTGDHPYYCLGCEKTIQRNNEAMKAILPKWIYRIEPEEVLEEQIIDW